jgi:flagellar biosynthesis/type III secretory pathway M-ring protein FliF/YscJ
MVILVAAPILVFFVVRKIVRKVKKEKAERRLRKNAQNLDSTQDRNTADATNDFSPPTYQKSRSDKKIHHLPPPAYSA